MLTTFPLLQCQFLTSLKGLCEQISSTVCSYFWMQEDKEKTLVILGEVEEVNEGGRIMLQGFAQV